MNAPERWLPVPEWERFYQISSHGRVRSLDRLDSLGRRREGRILAAVVNSDGYRQVRLFRDGIGHQRKVHQLVAAAFIKAQVPGTEVRHLDGDKMNNRLPNLAYGTHTDNMQDEILHGTNPHLRKTHCPHGHLYDKANTYIDHRGWRQCRTCKRERKRERDKHTTKPPKHPTAVVAEPAQARQVTG